MGHEVPNLIAADVKGADRRIRKLVPGYMTMGHTGMGGMGGMGMEMPLELGGRELVSQTLLDRLRLLVANERDDPHGLPRVLRPFDRGQTSSPVANADRSELAGSARGRFR
jgi:hypothetical protein